MSARIQITLEIVQQIINIVYIKWITFISITIRPYYDCLICGIT